MYGWRAKIGLLTPAINTIVEHDFARMAPEGVSIHTSRVNTAVEGSIEALENMAHDAVESGRLLGMAKPDVAVFACTSSSFLHGNAWTDKIEKAIGEATGSVCISTSSASVRALRRFDAKRVAVVTPYVAATNERLRSYLHENDFEVTQIEAFEVFNMYDHADIPASAIYAKIRSLDLKGVDAVFISCTQLKTIDIIDQMERDFGLPVVSAVQASFWAALDEMGVVLPMSGYGSLMEMTR